LYGAPTRSTQPYSLLVSDDQGASFHAIGKLAEPAAPARVAAGAIR
jgi:hypothetical protein